MPLIRTCSVCSRSEVEVRPVELTFRGYVAGKPHNRTNLRRVKAGDADLCERCMTKMCGDFVRDFKTIDQLIDSPKLQYRKTEAMHKLEKGLEIPKTPEKPKNAAKTPV